ncbi:MAG: hypothetical protein Q4G69_13210 [Planctomycetia bacterium]|nr:hypothetical protein [Planctomycetia bacterium]
MTGERLLELLAETVRRSVLIGSLENGIIAGLDLEGRLFAVHKNKVLNRVLPSSIYGRCSRAAFLNPGGDALWPAPEGTYFGYEYSTGSWRVPPAITGADWQIDSTSEDDSNLSSPDPDTRTLCAEIDLVNNRGIGIPCLFRRKICIENPSASGFTQKVIESIEYIGSRTIEEGEFLLAPWSLCQFDIEPESEIRFPLPKENDLWDLYASSEKQRRRERELCIVDPQTPQRFQLGLGASVPWIEYRCGSRFKVRRSVLDLSSDPRLIDIADSDPGELPSSAGTKLSCYCDPSGFMEIEGCGSSPKKLVPGTIASVCITTEYTIL